jgi:kynurenine formamidase
MIIDLTHTIAPDMPLYPGTPKPVLKASGTMTRDGWRETTIQISSHAGTHMDAPSHLLQNGFSLDVLPISQFCGRAAVLDVSEFPEGSVLPAEFFRQQKDALRCAEFVLLYTGFERKWGSEEFYGNFPVLSGDAARYLVSQGLKGVGTDALSVDPVNDKELPAHRTLLGGGLVILENLCLKKIVGRSDVMLFALPLKYDNADGAPVRAIAEFRDFSETEDKQA